MCSGPIVLLLLEGDGVIERFKESVQFEVIAYNGKSLKLAFFPRFARTIRDEYATEDGKLNEESLLVQ